MTKKSDIFVIILAAGYATRLKPLSNKIPKPLIEINGKTIISRIISTFRDAGFTNFCVLKGYKGEMIEEEVKSIHEIKIEFVDQSNISGMADAILLCINHLINKYRNINCFLISAADVLFSKEEISQCYSLYKKTKIDMILSLMNSYDVEIAKGHGNVKVSEIPGGFVGLKITDIIEKPAPKQILSSYYSLPFYLFNKSIIPYISNVELSERGEKEFQDAIKAAITDGRDIRGFKIINEDITNESIGRYHLTYLEDILKMNFRFLKGNRIEDSEGNYPTLLEPVNLGRGIKIGDTVLLGPNVIFNEGCQIGDYSKIENTIIFNHTILGKKIKLNHCLVDEKIQLPDNFQAQNCFITIDENNKKEFQIINF